jgi:hypothetical protein
MKYGLHCHKRNLSASPVGLHAHATVVTLAQGTCISARHLFNSGDGVARLTSPVWLDVINGQIKLTADIPRQRASLLRLKW